MLSFGVSSPKKFVLITPLNSVTLAIVILSQNKTFFAKIKAGREFVFAYIKFTSRRKLLNKTNLTKKLFHLIHNPNVIKFV